VEKARKISSTRKIDPSSGHLCEDEFERLLLLFKGKYLPYATKRVGEELAEDAMLQTCAILWTKRDVYKHLHGEKGFLGGWARATLDNVCRRILTSEVKHKTSDLPEGFEETLGSDDGLLGETLQKLISEDERRNLRRIIEAARLEGRYRSCTLLSLAGVAYSEMGYLLDMSPASARTCAGTGIKQIKNSIVPATVRIAVEYGDQGGWLGTVSKLLDEIRRSNNDAVKDFLPSNPHWLGRRLRENEQAIAKAGVAMNLYHTRRGAMVALWESHSEKIL
jgi:hypothetical protein